VSEIALELAEQDRDDRAARAGRGADCERAAELAAFALLELLDQLLLELQHPLRAAVEREPGLGRLDAAAGAVEQSAVEPFLERADLEADGRLRDAEPLGRLREAPSLDDRAEGRKLPRVHKGMLCTGASGRESGLRSRGG
jgi:hypothetical protein